MTAGRSAAILHIPHGSITIPEDLRASFLLDDQALQQELVRMTDWHTEVLFGLPRLQRIVFPASRLVVDPERLLEDDQEVMAARGMGVLYTCTSGGEPLRVPPSPEERVQLIDRFYRPHHHRLSEAVDGALEEHGYALVIDCHSFPSQPLPCDLDQDPIRPDLCIGTDSFHTPEWLRDAAVSALQAVGGNLRMGVDRPYAGALVPLEAWGRDPRVLAVMIEVNRGLYLEEATGQPSDGYLAIRRLIRQAVAQLVTATQERFARTPPQGNARLSGLASPWTIQLSPQPFKGTAP